MCTLSWWVEGSGRGVFFNRDEQRRRSPGLPGKIQIPQHGHPYLAPRDPEGGGTWVGVNRPGLVCALLNHYDAEAPPPCNPTSRGLLVRRVLASCGSLTEVEDFLISEKTSSFQPFLLFLLDSDAEAMLWTWNGRNLAKSEFASVCNGEPRLVTTSSYRADECRAYRTELFREKGPDRNGLLEAHQTTHHGNPALGPLMSRPDAATESLTEIKIGDPSAQLTFRTVRDRVVPTVGPPRRQTLPLAFSTDSRS